MSWYHRKTAWEGAIRIQPGKACKREGICLMVVYFDYIIYRLVFFNED
ncbi:MAG: hypothetical protein WA110_08450 [Anaerolineaceae bacterium]